MMRWVVFRDSRGSADTVGDVAEDAATPEISRHN
jgi:hypothetical protein